MVLHTTPYSGACLHFLDGLSWSLVFPCYWLLDQLLASCVATSLEKHRRSQDPCSFLTLCVLISAPLYLLLLLASLPLALLGFVIWAPLQAVRQPYLYTHRRLVWTFIRKKQWGVGLGEWRPQGRSFCFCSANVCLLPDSLARFNNLSDTHRRAREVGKRIRNGARALAPGILLLTAPEPDPQEEEAETGNHRPGEQTAGDTGSMTASRESLARYHGGDGGIGISSNNTLSHVPRTSIFKRPGRKRRHGDETFDHEISAFFPANLDFLALQEVFDHGSTTRLRRQLHRYFPYVLSDVGRYGWKGCCSSFKFLNSGLMLASRYPILDARFECYPNGRGEDALAAKGALFAKVHVGTSHQEQRVVGYLTCTHLHAIEGDASVRCEQLDLLLQWGAEFRQSSSQPPEGEKVLEDLVAFDVVLGDLNFDNCSSEDKLEQQHALFTQYKDPCRLGPGEDKPWALGLQPWSKLQSSDPFPSPCVSARVMENEEGRKEYLVFPPSKSHCPASSQKGRKIPLKGNGRRIDYMLYSDEGLSLLLLLQEIEEFSFVTQLAGLTDHLSVAMRLAEDSGGER
uniref:Sphingomyelin phosphodiesterase 3 n=1 Tax=Cyclopterus lumpus TaxID=8103 RepID=A0A8C2XFR0_CYCLU